MNISFVVLTYNNYDLTHQVLLDIAKKAPTVSEVIVVDNASTEIMLTSGLKFWQSTKVLPLKIITLPTNAGFVGGMNAGLTRATGEVVVAVSNDIRIHSSTILRDLWNLTQENTLVGQSLYQHDTGWNVFGGKIISYIEGYFVAARTNTWKQLGYFDPLYGTSDYEDVDLSMKCVSQGGSLKSLPVGSIQHLGGRTLGYDSDRLLRTKSNRIKFATKWGLPT